MMIPGACGRTGACGRSEQGLQLTRHQEDRSV